MHEELLLGVKYLKEHRNRQNVNVMRSYVPTTLIVDIYHHKKFLESLYQDVIIQVNWTTFSHNSRFSAPISLKLDGIVMNAMLSLIVARHF